MKTRFCTIIFFSVFFIFSRPGYALELTDVQILKAKKLAQSRFWHILLHYKSAPPFRGIQSQLDGAGFFFSEYGKTDPEAELMETARAFDQDRKIGRYEQHPQCAFPTRYEFLKKELDLKINDQICPKVEAFIESFNPESVSLVFSSAYPNSPGSMFGHTLLKINSRANDSGSGNHKKLDLLDRAINFAAGVPDDDNGLTFAWNGLFGGYIGVFTKIPYYVKVSEYGHAESRDLWEYELAIDREETIRLLKHAWEVDANSFFDYYFFDENCSYQILTFLEVAKPDWVLSNFGIYVIPADTVKKVMDIKGAVKSVNFRPSTFKKMRHRTNSLQENEKKELYQLVDSVNEASYENPISSIENPYVLEAFVTYLDYQKQKNEGLSDYEEKRFKETLLARSKLGGVTEPRKGEIPRDSRPELGHHSRRVGVRAGVFTEFSKIDGSMNRLFQELTLQFPYHDLLNNDLGFPAFSQIQFPSLTLRYVPSFGKLLIERVNLLSLTSLYPFNDLEKPLSWLLAAEFYSPKDFGCFDCRAFRLEAGGGVTLNLFSKKSIIYMMTTFYSEVSTSLKPVYRFGPTLRLASIINPAQKYKLQAASSIVTDLLQPHRPAYFYRFDLNQSYSLSRAFDLRAIFYALVEQEGETTYREVRLALNHYF